MSLYSYRSVNAVHRNPGGRGPTELEIAVVSTLPATPCSGAKDRRQLNVLAFGQHINRAISVEIQSRLVRDQRHLGIGLRASRSSEKSWLSKTSMPVRTAPLRVVTRREANIASL